jgi:hypothetical protein
LKPGGSLGLPPRHRRTGPGHGRGPCRGEGVAVPLAAPSRPGLVPAPGTGTGQCSCSDWQAALETRRARGRRRASRPARPLALTVTKTAPRSSTTSVVGSVLARRWVTAVTKAVKSGFVALGDWPKQAWRFLHLRLLRARGALQQTVPGPRLESGARCVTRPISGAMRTRSQTPAFGIVKLGLL